MDGEMIFVGTELLLGDILNTNAQYLSRRFADLGVSCFFQTVVGDNEERLKATIQQGLSRSEVVILCGGLGPTEDDLTKETLAKAVNKKLYMHEPSLEKIKGFFEKRGIQATSNNWKQAMMIEGCQVLNNDNGTAPGVYLLHAGTHVFILPGPPNEMVPMFELEIVPILKNLGDETLVSRTLRLVGIGESAAETLLRPILDAQINPTIAPYAKTMEVHFRMTAKAESVESAGQLLDELEEKVRPIVGQYIYSTDNEELEEVVIRLLREKNQTLSVAESCSAGLLASTLVNVSGASEVFMGGVVAYDNRIKEEILGMPHSVLEAVGAVSEETAKAMATGIREKFRTNIGIGITGIAGPTGGTPEKPVGLVYIAIADGQQVTVRKHIFTGNRSKVRQSAAKSGLILAYDFLKQEL